MMNMKLLAVVTPPSIYQNVWIFTGGVGVLEGCSVKSARRDKSDLNETADQ